MKNKRILIIDAVHSALTEMLEADGFECIQGDNRSDENLEDILPTVTGLVLRSRWSLDASWLQANHHLSFVARVGAGLEHIDQDAARSLGIVVLSSPEGNRQAVAEQALGMLLNLLHHIRKANDEVRKGVWQRKPNEGIELQGKTVGIIGFGNTGSAFAQVLSGFGVRVLAYDKYKTDIQSTDAESVNMQTLFENSDVVSLHIPQNQETKGLVSEAWIDAFHKPIVLINTSRGRIVQDQALLDAIQSEKVIGAALDVLSIEEDDLSVPEWEDVPSASKALIAHPRVLVTPHIAGLSKESYQKLAQTMAEKIIHLQNSA